MVYFSIKGVFKNLDNFRQHQNTKPYQNYPKFSLSIAS
ncbi:hypothetical protein BTURTLESOX_2486 [bacterium endosymbiont of Bathymodiolus sp. 5 South]|nr:hypothetical protein [uncultured Gammaproteobacteria bacterium]SHN92483.1 hypothetical protein BCLUESOX_2547 [bacterium endosymbiont of Bathymodiolus sp. 5 South]SSC08790.1 hypothetical protein BTURTLESOX_2486 [bacterium endosymbiont of Bathymodiolus sp. 5 South]VVH61653.1 hypothetical protein BSPWISOX_2878 [uncultured Gammaproteobacteria bacterium]VVH66597.1 hypothetical protein BSPLISOX_1179 [uncultured Gammaproteobacteria bacterium]